MTSARVYCDNALSIKGYFLSQVECMRVAEPGFIW